MTDLTKLRAELRAGLEGVTPGPWQPSPQKGRPRHGDQAQVFRDHADSDLSILALDMTETETEATATAAHIARCSPDNIRALLDALDDAERERRSLMLDRDLARADATNKTNIAVDLRKDVVRLDAECAKITRKRDEARAENRKWEKVAEAQENVNAKLIGKLDEARRERDEARAKALEEAAAYIGNTLAFDYGEQLYRDLIAAAIRALKDRAP